MYSTIFCMNVFICFYSIDQYVVPRDNLNDASRKLCNIVVIYILSLNNDALVSYRYDVKKPIPRSDKSKYLEKKI